jgi:hypothetical protein
MKSKMVGGHWAMGGNLQQHGNIGMEVDLAPNAAFQGLLDAIQAEEMQLDNPPPADSNSEITYSSGTSSSNSSDSAANLQLVVHEGLAIDMLPVHQIGEGLLNIAQAYLDEDEDELLDYEDIDNNMQQIQEEEQVENNNINGLLLLEDVNMVPPQEAHLIIGKVETHFFAIPEEHDLTRRFSKQGMQIWEKFFAPHLHNSPGGSSTCEIPVSWFNFVTLMLMTPDKFDWARGFCLLNYGILSRSLLEKNRLFPLLYLISAV